MSTVKCVEENVELWLTLAALSLGVKAEAGDLLGMPNCKFSRTERHTNKKDAEN